MGRGVAISAVLHGLLLSGALFGLPDIVFSEWLTEGLLTVAFAVLIGLVAWVLLSSPGFVAAVTVVVLFVLAASFLAQNLLRDAKVRSADPVEPRALDVEVVREQALDADARRVLARLEERLEAKDPSRLAAPGTTPRATAANEAAMPKAATDDSAVPPEPRKRPEKVISLAGKSEAETPPPKRTRKEKTPRVSVQIAASRITGDGNGPPSPRTRSGADPAVSAVFDRLSEAMPRVSNLRRALAAARSGRARPLLPSPHDARIEALARQGFPHAQFALAEKLLGDGADGKRLEDALGLLRSAAFGGHAPAQVALAMLEAEGHGDVADLGAAAAWLEIAEKSGVAGAASAREALTARMTAGDRVRARVRAAALLRLVSMMAPRLAEGQGSVSERLQLAVVLGDIEQVHLMLARDADPDKADKHGRTPLIESAWRGYVGIARALLRAGASPSSRDETGKDALQWAAINGHARVVSILLEAGAEVDARDGEGFTALMRAAWNGHADVVAALLRAGARTGIRNRHNLTALDYARREGHRAIVRLIEG